MNILSVAEMREIERQADAGGLSYAQMMQNAGQGAAAIIGDRVRRGLASADRPARVVVLVGPGNNGGDGLVCAAALSDAAAREGFPLTVQVYLLKPRPDDDPVFQPVRERGLFVADAANDLRLRVLHQMVTHASVIVDALLGTGASRPIEGLLRDILREVRANRPSLVVALDGVTGMNYDTGALDPSAVPADMTVTFHAPKRGHYCFPAAGACGELVVAPIGVAGDAPAKICLADDALVWRLLPERRLDANKGTHGRALIVGGCSDYSGAPALAAAAAYRAGAGLVTAAVPPAIQPIVASACREVTYATLPGSDGSLVPGALPRVLEWVEGAKDRSALLIGPGMGQATATRDFYFSLLQRLRSIQNLKLVIDADGLNMLAAIEGWPDMLPERCVLTPHPGEMARLSASSIQDVQADRIGLALCERSSMETSGAIERGLHRRGVARRPGDGDAIRQPGDGGGGNGRCAGRGDRQFSGPGVVALRRGGVRRLPARQGGRAVAVAARRCGSAGQRSAAAVAGCGEGYRRRGLPSKDD